MTSQDSSNGTLIFRLSVPGRMPLLNQLFAMHHRVRAKFKEGIQADFLSACDHFEQTLPTRTDWLPNFTSIALDTSPLSRMIAQRSAKSKSRKRKSPKAKSARKSKSSK